MSSPSLIDLLELDRIDRDIFQARSHESREGRLFGGQIAAQALRSAAHTVHVDHEVNSLHCYFLRPGRYGVPVTYLVDRIRDGASFSTRRIVALQDGEAILNLDASFHTTEPGYDFELPSPLGQTPNPEELTDSRRHHHHHPFLQREISSPASADVLRARWVKTVGELPDDPVIHACALVYMSDSGPVSAAMTAIEKEDRWDGQFMTASLDHNIWFHRRARADEWLLYELGAVAAHGARGLARGAMWSSDGHLAVSIVQESLLRERRATR